MTKQNIHSADTPAELILAGTTTWLFPERGSRKLLPGRYRAAFAVAEGKTASVEGFDLAAQYLDLLY
jgi:hypothetical protein